MSLLHDHTYIIKFRFLFISCCSFRVSGNNAAINNVMKEFNKGNMEDIDYNDDVSYVISCDK